MEPHSNLRLLLIALCLVISTNSARSRLSPDVSPVPHPPLSSEALDYSLETAELIISRSESEAEPEESDSLSQSKIAYGIGSTSHLQAGSAVDPQVKKICDQTDHSALCLATVLPLIKDKPSVDSVLQVSVQAGSDYAKEALSQAKKLIKTPGTPKGLLSTFKDCKDGYDTAVDNFQKTLDAFATDDVGTMRTMLSAVITFVGDCQDQFQEMQIDSPLSGYADKLTQMASNCLAISSLKN